MPSMVSMFKVAEKVYLGKEHLRQRHLLSGKISEKPFLTESTATEKNPRKERIRHVRGM